MYKASNKYSHTLFGLLVFLLVGITSFAEGISDDVSQRHDFNTIKFKDSSLKAQYWRIAGINSLSFTQTGFHNWAEGGDNAISASAFINWIAKYEKKNVLNSNYLRLAYGMVKPEQSELRKTDDVIDFGQTFSWRAYGKFYYSTQYSLKSQFAPGYKYPNDSVRISDFFAPATLELSVGMRYSVSNYFSLFLSPASGTIVFVLDQELADRGVGGVKPAEYETVVINDSVTEEVKVKGGSSWRPSVGILLELGFTKSLMKNIALDTKLKIRNNYMDQNENNRWRFDVDWQMLMNFTINKFFSANIRLNLIYDHDIPIPYTAVVDGEEVILTGPRLQFKDVIGIGLAYNFSNNK